LTYVQTLRSSAVIFMTATDSCRPGIFRKTSLLRDRSNGDAVRRQPTNPHGPQPRRPASPRTGNCDGALTCAHGEIVHRSGLSSGAGLERSPLHDVRQHAPQRTRGRTHQADASVRIDVLSGRAASLPMQQYESRRRATGAAGTSGAFRAGYLRQSDRAAAGLVEPDGIEPTTSCLQSRRSPN
jgi:hypothetical protein